MIIPSLKTTLYSKLAVCGALFAALGASVQAQPVDKTPVLHLSFDSVNGTTVLNDGSGGSLMNGTLNGSATIVSGGKFGNCLNITGAAAADASCRIANAVVPLTVGNTWTVAMWVKTTTPGGCYAYQGDGGWANANTSFYMNSGSTTGDHQGGVRYAQGWEAGSAIADDGAWHHLVMVCDGTTKTLYFDGNVDGFIATGYNGDSWNGTGAGAQFWIGGNAYSGDGSANLNGQVDEAYVFNKALSAADVQQLFSNNTYPHVPVVATVTPASGYRGQTITITATATPVGGATVTNATVDLSAIGLSATAALVQSTANVFTNTFTVPAKAAIGAANLSVTVADTEPLIGRAGAAYTVVALPPTNATALAAISGSATYQFAEASFHFAATNDSPDHYFAMNYTWFTNGVAVSTNAMGPDYTFLSTPSDIGKTIVCIARVADTNFSSICVTSATVTLAPQTGALVYNNGMKREFFANGSRGRAEIGNVPAGLINLVTNVDLPDGNGFTAANYAQRISGYFIPPTSANYVFFVASDDDCDVFLSTDNSPLNKRLICQEAGWSGLDNWFGDATPGGGSTPGQKRSDQWTNVDGTMPYASGIPLTAGQPYYFEAVMHQGGGGDHVGVTYTTTTEMLDPNWYNYFTNGMPSRMTAANNNISAITWAGTNITWSLQPQNLTAFEGQNKSLSALALSDAEMVPNYQWFKVAAGGALPGTPLTGLVPNGTNLTLVSIPFQDNGSQIYCVASTEEGSLSITSSVAILTVQQAVFETGWVGESKWMTNQYGAPGGQIESGTAPAPTFTCVRPGFEVGLDNPSAYIYGNHNINSSLQQIGFFVPPTSGNYVFFITSHDQGDLFLSTDNTPAKKRRIAQEAGWSNNWNWNQAGGGGSVISQKRSDTFSPDGGATTPYAAGIALVAGQRYYMEVDHNTSGWGNEQVGVYYAAMSGGTVTAPADGTLPNAFGSVVGMNAVRCTYVAFTQQPANVSAPVMGYATFTAQGATDSQYPTCSPYGYTIVAPTNALFFQWYTNGVAVPGATAGTLALGPLMPSDNGIQVMCKMRALGYADNSLNPIWTNSTPATLSVTGQSVFEPGVAWVDWWTNTTSIANVESGGAGLPSFSYVSPKFAAPTVQAPNNYVDRVSALFMPTNTGLYTFFANSDDDSDLFLNITGPSPSGKQMVAQQTTWANAYQWTSGGAGSATQKRSDSWVPAGGTTPPFATGIQLTAGQKYWLEGVHHDTGGGNNFEATFKGYYDPDPANGSDTALQGGVIGAYVPRVAWVAFLQQPVSQSQLSGGNPVTFTVKATNAPSIALGTTGNPFNFITNTPQALQYQWYKNGVLIPGATGASYTQPYVLPSDNNAQFVCAMRALGYADDALNRIYSNSTPAVLTVVTDTNPPSVLSARAFQNANQNPPLNIVDITFSKWMDPATLTNPANYSITGITKISISGDHRTVELQLDHVPTLPLTITVTGITDLSGNALTVNSAAAKAVNLTFTDIGSSLPGDPTLFGLAGYDPAYASSIFAEGNGRYEVIAEGSDIWNAADGFNFGYELKTNDFDVVVRNEKLGHSSQYAKMGLMVREDLTPASRNWNVVSYPASADGIMAPDMSGYGNNNIEANMRGTNAGTSYSWRNKNPGAPTYPNAWLRLKRSNDVLIAFSSTNGLVWTQIAAYDTSTNANGRLPSTAYVGICSSAHNNDASPTWPPPPPVYLNSAQFADYNSSYVYVPPAANPATLSVSVSGANVLVSWTPSGGHLESSPAIGSGQNWQTVGTSNPATVPIGPGAQFFRVVNP